MSIDHEVPSSTVLIPPAAAPYTATESPDIQIPRRHTVTSCLGLGPIPPNQVIAVHTLTDEAVRSALPRDGATLTHGEAAIRSKAERAAQSNLDRAVSKHIEPAIAAIRPLMAEINIFADQIGQARTSPLRGPDGETLTPEGAQGAHDAYCDDIAGAQRNGSKKFTIRPRSKVKEWALTAVDYPVFLYAMLSLLNVNYALIWFESGATIKAIIAGVFALLGTLMLAFVSRFMGRRHRAFKGHSATIETDAKNRLRVRLELAAMAAMVTMAVLVMASRVIIDGLDADVLPLLVYTLASLFGILIGFSAYINYCSEYDNGSEETDRLRLLSAQLSRRAGLIEGLLNGYRLRVEETGIRIARLNRLIAQAGTDAEHIVTGSRQDKAILLARSYHGLTGSASALPPPALDYRRLDLASEQARQLTDHQEYLETIGKEG